MKECFICKDDIEDNHVIKLEACVCNDVTYHKECIGTWAKTSCAYKCIHCYKNFTENDYQDLALIEHLFYSSLKESNLKGLETAILAGHKLRLYDIEEALFFNSSDLLNLMLDNYGPTNREVCYFIYQSICYNLVDVFYLLVDDWAVNLHEDLLLSCIIYDRYDFFVYLLNKGAPVGRAYDEIIKNIKFMTRYLNALDKC